MYPGGSTQAFLRFASLDHLSKEKAEASQVMVHVCLLASKTLAISCLFISMYQHFSSFSHILIGDFGGI